jgi:serine protease Do
VRWSDKKPVLGSFLATPQPDGRPAGFGVVSVLERDLRETNQAFLGIQGDIKFDGPGVRIEDVTRESGAAAAGLKAGDIILKVGDRPISGVLELRNSLIGISPGSKIDVVARTDRGEKTFEVLLGNRPKLGGFQGDRLRAMERMGGRVNQVRDSFPNAIQTDMRLKTDQIGGPVVNLDGDVVGVTIARADRTRSFVISAAGLRDLLKKPAQDPSVAKIREEQAQPFPVRGNRPPGRMMPGNPDRLRQHLSEMQRLMDFMREEMESLEEPAER